ncbi:MAG: pyridoxal phosphate-dependent aminotransferase [Candidatus Omnitrophica bacterium]|nr:pyridoxal phosphate-dependent aminotransferase [Candidatus Omnitrophota bacterium]
MVGNRIAQITPSVTLEITARAKALKAKGSDVVNFAAGEPDFDTPDFIKDAAIKAIENGLTKYTPASGTSELKEAVCEKFAKDNGLSYKSGQVAIGCGAKHSLYNLFQALCEEGDEVILPSPYWLSYPEMIKLAGAKPVVAETDRKSFTMRPEDLNSRITRKTKAIIINSPSNPCGAVYSKDALQKIADIAVKHNISVVSDEIYEKLIYDGLRHVSIASLNDDIYGLTFVVNGVSKSYAMTGWRIGYVAGREDLIKGISALQSHSTSNPSSISQAAALAALKSDADTVVKMAQEFEKKRNIMIDELSGASGIDCIKPMGAFYCFANISGTGMDGLTFSKKLLDEKHVAVIPGAPFGMKNYIRLSFATSVEDIKRGAERIREWVKQ